MRWLFVAAVFAINLLPALANPCNRIHPSPENPTIILTVVGGSIMMWRYARARWAK